MDDTNYDEEWARYNYPQNPEPAQPYFDPEWDPFTGWRWSEGVAPPQGAPDGQVWQWFGHAPDGSRARTGDYGWQHVLDPRLIARTPQSGPPDPNQPPPPPGPPPGPVPTPGLSPAFNWTTYNPAPMVNPFQPFTYADFSYQDFKAPTLEEARNEPGFAFAFEQGQKALENSAASRGTLRTGGTMKDLIAWGQKAGEQNYGNVYTRAADTYDRNRANAFGSWSGNLQKEMGARGINWGEFTDTYDRNNANARDAFNAAFRRDELTFEDLYRRDRDRLNAYTLGGRFKSGHSWSPQKRPFLVSGRDRVSSTSRHSLLANRHGLSFASCADRI